LLLLLLVIIQFARFLKPRIPQLPPCCLQQQQTLSIIVVFNALFVVSFHVVVVIRGRGCSRKDYKRIVVLLGFSFPLERFHLTLDKPADLM
jgi:hypothetical protein